MTWCCCSEYHRDTNQLHVVLERGDTDMATFFQRHSKDGSMTPDLIRFYWTQMLNAVGLLHREGETAGLLVFWGVVLE